MGKAPATKITAAQALINASDAATVEQREAWMNVYFRLTVRTR